MIRNIVSFDHLMIMQQIVEMKMEGTTDLDLTGNKDEKILLMMAMKNKSYDMIACLVKLGLKARSVWGKEYTFLELRDRYKGMPEYGEEFANKYFGCTDGIAFKLELFDLAEGD
jgi:hypothetical protein